MATAGAPNGHAANGDPANLPYWLVNVPQEEWPAECPEFLKSVSDKDRGILQTPDSKCRRLSWPEVQEVVGKSDPVLALMGRTDGSTSGYLYALSQRGPSV